MNPLLVNWKTSLAGVILILIGLLGSLLGVHIPGFSMDPGAALAAGLGLLMAHDAAPSPLPAAKVMIAFLIMPLGCLFLIMAEARAGDINAPATKAAPAAAPVSFLFPVNGNGPIFGVFTEGGGSSVSASVPGVPPASLTTTTAGVGFDAGYMWKIKSNLSVALRGSFEAQNFNGNNAGLSVQGPVRAEVDAVLYAPWQTVFTLLPNLWNPFSSISAFSLPAGINPTGNALAGLGFFYTGADISTAIAGLQSGKAWRTNPGLLAETVQPVTTGGAVRLFAKWDFLNNSKIFGKVPAGFTVSTLASNGFRAGVGYEF